MSIIKTIIFDVMGVVFTVGDDVESLLIPYIHSLKPEIEAQRVKDVFLPASLGKMPSREFWARLGFEQADIQKIERDYLERSFTLDPGFIPCAKALKERYGIALLSNDISEWSKYLRTFHGIEPLIDAAFISGDIGVRKPDPQAFHIALDALGTQPSDCVFTDDSPERVDIARELGISSILFDRGNNDYNGLRVRTFEQLTRLLV